MQKRVNWIDWAKAFGIYLVVFGHYYLPLSADGPGRELVTLIYTFHMPLFFFISGYLFSYKKDDNIVSFIKSNIFSLIIPYVFFSVLSTLIILPSDTDYLNKHTLFLAFIGHPYGPSGPSWFIFCLLFVRIFSYGILKLKTTVQIVFLLCSILIAYFMPIYLWWSITSSFMALPFYIVGYHIKKTAILNKTIKPKYYLIFTPILLTLLVICNRLEGPVDLALCDFGKYPPLYYFQALVGITLFISYCMLLNKYSFRVIKIISSGTIIIMGLHMSIAWIIIPIMDKALLLGIDRILYSIIISFLIVILFIPIILLFQKHIPFLIGNRK